MNNTTLTINKDFLQHFASGENVMGTNGVSNNTSGAVTPYSADGLSAEMRTYYSDYLVDNAEPYLVHDLFAQKHRIPVGGGKTISFRKYDPLPKRTDPITEGVTPDGQDFHVSVVEATVAQYGGYIELTDLLLMTAVDNNLVMATKLLGAQAGRTLDTVSREVLCGGTNVQYGENAVSARHLLVGGKAEGNHYLTVDCIRRAVRFLKGQNAEKINGSYVGIIHPDCAYDLMSDPNWKTPNQYADGKQIFEGEIGKIEGVRFIESTEAKIFHSDNVIPSSRTLTVTSTSNSSPEDNIIYVDNDTNESIGERWVIIKGKRYFIVNEGGPMTYTYTDSTKSTPINLTYQGVAPGDVVYPGDAGAEGRDVYATLIIADNAYGTTEITGGGLEHIVKQLGSSGTSDPLNQRATVGWKASKVTARLVEAFMVRIETTSTFESGRN